MSVIDIHATGIALVRVHDRIGGHVIQNPDLGLNPEADLFFGIDFLTGRLDQPVNQVVMGKIGVRPGTAHNRRIGMKKPTQIDIRIGSPGHIDHDRPRVLSNDLVHVGMRLDRNLAINADPGQLFAQGRVIIPVKSFFRRDEFQCKSIGIARFGKQLSGLCQVVS